MDRVIPKDVIDLIYKETHIGNVRRLNEEYLQCYVAITHYKECVTVQNRTNGINYCYRILKDNGCRDINIYGIKYKKVYKVSYLPKRYFYSSGHSEFKWIE